MRKVTIGSVDFDAIKAGLFGVHSSLTVEINDSKRVFDGLWNDVFGLVPQVAVFASLCGNRGRPKSWETALMERVNDTAEIP